MKYSHAAILFGIGAVALAPIAIHNIQSANGSLGLLVGLAIFASFPLKKLFQIEGIIQEAPVTLIYFGILWAVGFGWKRSWKARA